VYYIHIGEYFLPVAMKKKKHHISIYWDLKFVAELKTIIGISSKTNMQKKLISKSSVLFNYLLKIPKGWFLGPAIHLLREQEVKLVIKLYISSHAFEITWGLITLKLFSARVKGEDQYWQG